MRKIRIEKGQEMIDVLTKEFEKEKLQDGAIVSVIGACDECCISTMPKADAMENNLTEYHEPLELMGVGEIRDGKPHIHVTLGREENVAIMGHLHWARVKSWYITVFYIPYQ